MTNSQKPYVRPQPKTKSELREMLKQAVENTQAEPKSKSSSKSRKDQA